MVRLLLVAVLAVPQPVRAQGIEPTFRQEPLAKLLKELKDKDVMLRRQAATTLGMPDGSQGKGGPIPRGDLWPAMLGLIDAQQDKDTQVRANAMKSLGLLMRYRGVPEEAQEKFEKCALAAIAALKDPEDLVKTEAGNALPLIGIDTKKGIEALQAILKDENAKVRAAGANAAKGARPIAGIVPALADRVSDSDTTVRLAAVNSLIFARTEATGALKPLIAALKDEELRVAVAAATALGGIGIGAGDAVPALIDATVGDRKELRTTALSSLGTIRHHRELAVPALVNALAVEDTKLVAMGSLAIFGSEAKDAVPAILANGRDAKGSVQGNALYALSVIDPTGPAFFELLFAAIHDPNPAVRNLGIGYFGQHGGYPEALPILATLFKADPAMRQRIAYAFRSMGAEAKPVVPMLMEVIGDLETNPQLRRILVNAVNVIDPTLLKKPGANDDD